MHEELTQVLNNKNVTLPVHRGEKPMDTPVIKQQSFISQLANAEIHAAIAFSFVAFVALAVVSLTMQLPAELDIQAAVTDPSVIAQRKTQTKVLGTTTTGPLAATLKVNGQDKDVVRPGTEVRLAWSSQNADTCVVLPIGAEGLRGEGLTEGIYYSQEFTLECSRGTKVVKDTVFVGVLDNPAATQ